MGGAEGCPAPTAGRGIRVRSGRAQRLHSFRSGASFALRPPPPPTAGRIDDVHGAGQRDGRAIAWRRRRGVALAAAPHLSTSESALTTAHLNRIATAVPPHDVHSAFVRFARTLLDEPRAKPVFDRMAAKAQIGHRYSVLAPAADPEGVSVDASRVYSRGRFPTTAERMQLFEKHAPALAVEAVGKLELGPEARRITHVIVTSCTGMYAPGLDLDLVEQCGLEPSVERTMVGFMGCYAAINALKLARHIVRSAPEARVLLVNLELCTLHM
ncbi:MAG TPA: hypothetical protein VF316_04565, partial [Polyangiaceae bacterium]